MRWRLKNPNNLGARLVLLVIGESPDGWLVRVPVRPNGSIGWVRGSDVDVQVTDYALRVSLHRHRLMVYRDGRRVREFPVAVGRKDAPTPMGSFFLTELLEPRRANGPYGPFAYGLSAFSDVYSEFEGGPGQIGLHGTNDPSSIGRSVSHGCIRMRIPDITELAHIVPAGTPITVVP